MGTNTELVNVTRPARLLSGNLSGDVAKALAEAAGALLSVANARSGQGTFCAQPSRPLDASLTVGQLTREFLLAKARAGKSDRYLRALKNSLSKFSAGRNRRSLSRRSPFTTLRTGSTKTAGARGRCTAIWATGGHF